MIYIKGYCPFFREKMNPLSQFFLQMKGTGPSKEGRNIVHGWYILVECHERALDFLVNQNLFPDGVGCWIVCFEPFIVSTIEIYPSLKSFGWVLSNFLFLTHFVGFSTNVRQNPWRQNPRLFSKKCKIPNVFLLCVPHEEVYKLVSMNENDKYPR